MRALDTLAWVEARSGNSAEALRRYTALLEIYTRRLGPKDVDTIRTMNNVACNQYLEGQREQAEELAFVEIVRLEREVAQQRRQRDRFRRSTTLHASIYLDRGEWEEGRAAADPETLRHQSPGARCSSTRRRS